VIVLGDTHFDGLVHATYHSHNPNPPAYQIEEWDRNAGMWADREDLASPTDYVRNLRARRRFA